VPETATLAKLGLILEQTIGWQGGHLHEYIVGRVHYGIPDDDWPSPEPFKDERRTRLNTRLNPELVASPSSAGNLYIADTNHGTALSGPGGGPALKIRWKTPQSVILTSAAGARVFLARQRIEDVQIEYGPDH
jgi:Plasmid pRiA4b ORF-3-like protein